MRSRVDSKIIGDVGATVDESQVTLAIHGAGLNPSAVSKLLGVEPTSAHAQTDPRRSGLPPWPSGAWILSLEAAAPAGPDELLALLLDKLPRDPAVWRELSSTYTVRLAFGIFIAQWHRGFSLAPASIQRLATLGAEVGFSIYFVGERSE